MRKLNQKEIEFITKVVSDPKLYPSSIRLLLAMVKHKDLKTNFVLLRQLDLAIAAGLSSRHVSRWSNQLVELNYVKTHNHKYASGKRGTKYELLMD